MTISDITKWDESEDNDLDTHGPTPGDKQTSLREKQMVYIAFQAMMPITFHGTFLSLSSCYSDLDLTSHPFDWTYLSD